MSALAMTKHDSKQLPTFWLTLIEQDAVAYARAVILDMERGSPWGGQRAGETSAFVGEMLRLGLHSAEGRLRLTWAARAGDPDAQAVLRTAILEAKSWDQPLPVELRAYEMDIIARAPMPVSGSVPGAKRKYKLLRNVRIALAVAALVDRFGLPPTGRSPRRHSAAKLVALALGQINRGIGVKAVETIWQAAQGFMPTEPGWTR
jgi:hypothetical protein